MPSGVFKITDIPEEKVEEVEANYRLQNPAIEKFKQPNGKWTVIATFPGDGESEEVFNG